MTSNQKLTWGLLIATYQREKILPLCIKFATEQTIKPVEIVIVDASKDWEKTRDTIVMELASNHPDIRWVYAKAEVPSSSMQRNQGVKLSTTDIVFLIDDDSLMYPTCAEEIMRVYEADSQGIVKAVQAKLVESPPSATTVTDSTKKTGWSIEWLSKFGVIQHFLWKHVLLMNAEMLWIPYDGDYPQHDIPKAIKQLNCYPIKMLHGCRMTFRRDAVLKEEFEPLLRHYAAGEDMDISNKVNRHGLLVEAPLAKIHHFHSASGRLARAKVSALSALNVALFIKKNSTNLRRDQKRFYFLMTRRLIAEVMKDCLSRRWSLPQVRGLMTALKYSPKVFTSSQEKLTQWYPRFQQKLFVSTKLID